MQKLKQLTEFLIHLNLVAAEQIESWVENPQIVPSGKIISHDGIILYRQYYDAVFSIDRYPHARHPAELLFGQVCAWLLTNDPERDNIATPHTDVDIIDAETADIEITIEFREDVQAVADPAGPIFIDGQHYRLADAVVDTAEAGEVVT